MTEVLPNLWLGDFKISESEQFLRSSKIDTIINCTETFPFPPNFNGKCIRVPVLDNQAPSEIWKMFKYLDLIQNIIYKERSRNANILIHCHAGRHRSVTIILAYLMAQGNLTLDKAYLLLKTKRASLTNLHFKWALEQYATYLGTGEIKN